MMTWYLTLLSLHFLFSCLNCTLIITHTCHLGVVGDSHTAYVVIGCCGNLSGTSCAVTGDSKRGGGGEEKLKMISINLHTFANDILWFKSELWFYILIEPLFFVELCLSRMRKFENGIGRPNLKVATIAQIMWREDVLEGKRHSHPFTERLSESECDCTDQCFVCTMWCVSFPPSFSSPQGHCGVNPSFPACFATDRQLFITTSWLASKYCPAVSSCYSTIPKYPLLYLTDTSTYVAVSEQMEVQRRRGRERIQLPLLLCPTCVTLIVDPLVWLGDGRLIRHYQAEGHHYEHLSLRGAW